jgi:hypothetical protein
MKALIIYDSTFGNTEHIAQAIAQELREHGSVQLVTWDIARHLQEAGASLILSPESFFVAGIRGPLDEGELERAMQWATTLLERFEEAEPYELKEERL